jgi:hypothetical protein
MHKLNFKCIKDLKIKLDKLNLLEEKNENPQTAQTTAKTMGCYPQTDSKALLLLIILNTIH